MILKISKSLLLMMGLMTLCLSLSTVVYMTIFWSPIRFHYLVVRSGLNLWTLPVPQGLLNAGEAISLTVLPSAYSVTPRTKNSSKKTSFVYEASSTSTATSFQGAVGPLASFNLSLSKTNVSRQWKGKHWKPGRIVKDLKNLPPSWDLATAEEKNASRYLCYICDAMSMCGGWGDRQRALTSIYIWARALRRRFKLVMTTPCNLTNFYVPNRVDWLAVDGEMEPPNANNTLSTYFMPPDGWGRLRREDLNQRFPGRVVYVRTNSDLFFHIADSPAYVNLSRSWSGLRDHRSRFFWAWHELMKPSPRLIDRLGTILGTSFLRRKGFGAQVRNKSVRPMRDVGNSSLICAHVRVGKNPSNPRDEPFIAVTGDDIPVLLRFMKNKASNVTAHFFIATDYINVRLQAKQFFGPDYIDYGGRISHIDRQRRDNDACLGFESALLDQLILSVCDVLIISRSGFSVRAAHMRNSTDPVYLIDGGEVKVAEE